MHVEYSTRPFPYEIFRLPNGKFIGFFRENITSDIREMDDNLETCWMADEYSLTLNPRPGLEQDIANNTAAYLARAKTEAERQASEKAIRAYEQELANNMPEMVLEMDYEIMMMKEFGGIL